MNPVGCRFADALRADSLTRWHWQVLNTIALEARSLEDVDEPLSARRIEWRRISNRDLEE